jgi:hypothetical protein
MFCFLRNIQILQYGKNQMLYINQINIDNNISVVYKNRCSKVVNIISRITVHIN